MDNLKIFCLCINDELLDKVKELNLIPVALGEGKYSKGWIRDNTGSNISHKNRYYGEYTFHYWIWKNNMNVFNDKDWVGFCAYRRFWLKNNQETNSKTSFKDSLLKTVPKEWNNYDTILANKISMKNIKIIKIIKYGKLALLSNPKSIFKNKRNIKFQFDMFHGVGVLDQAIDLLDMSDREEFRDYVKNNDSFNPANLFICRSRKIMKKYYQTIFKWFERCEKIFGFNLKGYGKIRIYAFLAERYLPFWFNKYTRCLDWPILFNDLIKNTNE